MEVIIDPNSDENEQDIFGKTVESCGQCIILRYSRRIE